MLTLTTANEQIATAAQFIGHYGDCNKFNEWYWCQLNGYAQDPCTAWCAAFQSYVAMLTGLPCNYSASAAAFGTQFPQVADVDVKPGDIVVFNWDGRTSLSWCDHVGLVEWSDINGTGYFGTIEGNTNNSDVARMTRYNWGSYFTAFFRPSYDGTSKPSKPSTSKPSTAKPSKPSTSGQPRYAAYAGGSWLPDMLGRKDTGGSSDNFAGELGKPITYLAIDGVGKYRVKTQANGWLPWVDKFDKSDFEYGCAGDGSPIIAIEIPNGKFKYAAHNMGGGWNSPMVGNKDTGGSSDTFAGDNVPIDAFWIQKA